MANKLITLEQSKKYADNLEIIVSNLKKQMEKLILTNSVMENGIITIEAENLTVVYNQIEELISNSGYFQATVDAFNDNQDIVNLRFKELSKIIPKEALGRLPLERLQAITDLNLEVLSAQETLAFESVRQMVQLNVVNGVSLDTLTEDLGKILDKNLKQNPETILRTAKRQFAQDLENLVAEEIGFNENEEAMWEYIGDPLVKDSHDECIWALSERIHPYFTNQQKDEFEAGIYPKHLSGRSAIRFNCHHNFWITIYTKDEIGKEYGVAE